MTNPSNLSRNLSAERSQGRSGLVPPRHVNGPARLLPEPVEARPWQVADIGEGRSGPVPQTKSYVRKSVDEAIAQALEELGPEAVLVSTRRLAKEQGIGACYEVVFAMPEPRIPPPAPPSRALPEDLAADVERLHAQMDEIRNLLMRPTRARLGAVRMAPEFADVYECLLASDVDPVLSKDIVDRLESSKAVDEYLQRAQARKGQPDHRAKAPLSRAEALETSILAELERRVAIAPRLGQNGVVLIGPPGAGKTSSAAKLASFVSDLAETRPVRLLSPDSSRQAPHVRLQEMAQALGIAFTKVPSVEILPALIADARTREFLLVDTPGYASSDGQAMEAAAAALGRCPGIEIHLVAPGYMKSIDLRHCIQRYKPFRPSRLIVTKLDETQTFGSVFSEAARAGLALSFLAHGPMIPRDIRPASADDLLVLAMERHLARAAHAG
jgi:flagellar biosynthesis GTPase FlhF